MTCQCSSDCGGSTQSQGCLQPPAGLRAMGDVDLLSWLGFYHIFLREVVDFLVVYDAVKWTDFISEILHRPLFFVILTLGGKNLLQYEVLIFSPLDKGRRELGRLRAASRWQLLWLSSLRFKVVAVGRCIGVGMHTPVEWILIETRRTFLLRILNQTAARWRRRRMTAYCSRPRTSDLGAKAHVSYY